MCYDPFFAINLQTFALNTQSVHHRIREGDELTHLNCMKRCIHHLVCTECMKCTGLYTVLCVPPKRYSNIL